MNAKVALILPFIWLPWASMAQPLPEDFLLVAHRGVVNDTLVENSLAALEETIRRGYTHIEVDLRVTKDGQTVCLHDRSLQRTVGLQKNIDEITLDELYSLTTPDLVPTLELFSERSAGRIDLMPDVKEVPLELADAFYAGILSSLEKHDLMEGALFIGWPEVVDRFIGKAKINWREPLQDVKEKITTIENAPSKYFIFNHAADFNQAEVEGFHALGLEVIVSINTFHYPEDPMENGRADIAEMLKLGVDGLQIDSVYDPYVLKTED